MLNILSMPTFSFARFPPIQTPKPPILFSKIFLSLVGEDLSNLGVFKKILPPSRLSEELIHESLVSLIGVPSLCVLAMRCKPFMRQYMAIVT